MNTTEALDKANREAIRLYRVFKKLPAEQFVAAAEILEAVKGICVATGILCNTSPEVMFSRVVFHATK